jgi:hypothetical protein
MDEKHLEPGRNGHEAASQHAPRRKRLKRGALAAAVAIALAGGGY